MIEHNNVIIEHYTIPKLYRALLKEIMPIVDNPAQIKRLRKAINEAYEAGQFQPDRFGINPVVHLSLIH
ncbi:MAG: hypothetical protein K2H61_01580, partial [Muribaculaceae bacterium]|nr:hypothetical protein [Muribaculaceae bacterium]